MAPALQSTSKVAKSTAGPPAQENRGAYVCGIDDLKLAPYKLPESLGKHTTVLPPIPSKPQPPHLNRLHLSIISDATSKHGPDR